ncbi:hypothetical protein ACYATM_00480 [Lactobacillaceae bacterium Scapto_B20]
MLPVLLASANSVANSANSDVSAANNDYSSAAPLKHPLLKLITVRLHPVLHPLLLVPLLGLSPMRPLLVKPLTMPNSASAAGSNAANVANSAMSTANSAGSVANSADSTLQTN